MIECKGYKEFANYLSQHLSEDNDTIEFATCQEVELENGEEYSSNDFSCWYFAKLMGIEGYESRFIIIDYCGGEEARAIPINNYSTRNNKTFDDEDIYFIEDCCKSFFNQCNNIGGENMSVWIDTDNIK